MKSLEALSCSYIPKFDTGIIATASQQLSVGTKFNRPNRILMSLQRCPYYIGTGCTNREIAKQLYIAEGTVKSHVTHILNRLNLKNRSQIAIYANSLKQAC